MGWNPGLGNVGDRSADCDNPHGAGRTEFQRECAAAVGRRVGSSASILVHAIASRVQDSGRVDYADCRHNRGDRAVDEPGGAKSGSLPTDQNLNGIAYGIADLVMFAIPLIARAEKPSWPLRAPPLPALP